MNSAAIVKEIELAYLRCRMGLISVDLATKEVAMLQAMLRAWDQAELERETRRAPGHARGTGGSRPGQGAWLSGERT